MPAAAVASFTPAIAGISGTWVGASGEIADDMEASGFEQRKRSVSPQAAGRERARRAIMLARRPGLEPGSIATVVKCAKFGRSRGIGPGSEAGTTPSLIYFFAGAILVSAGLASGFAAASSGLSRRSTLAVSRS